jgi:Tfp pilus assembly protein PilN
MLKINIKPTHLKKPKKESSAFLITICIILIAFIGIVSGILYILNIQLNAKISDVKKQNLDLKTENSSMFELDRKIRKFDKRLNEIETLEKQRISYSDLLKAIATKTPADVQITNLSLNQEKDKEQTISGVASSNRSAMLFRSELEKINYFNNVDLEATTLRDDNTVEFKFNVNLKS